MAKINISALDPEEHFNKKLIPAQDPARFLRIKSNYLILCRVIIIFLIPSLQAPPAAVRRRTLKHRVYEEYDPRSIIAYLFRIRIRTGNHRYRSVQKDRQYPAGTGMDGRQQESQTRHPPSVGGERYHPHRQKAPA